MTLLTTPFKVLEHHKHGISHENLYKVLRGLAVDNARNKFSAVDISKQTDSTTGTVGALAQLAVPASTFLTDGVATTGSPKTGFDTAIGKLANCAGSYANFINYYLAELGYDQIAMPSGATITAALPALDKTLSGVATTGAVEGVTGRAELVKIANNFSTLLLATNRIAAALGYDPMTDPGNGTAAATLTASATTASSVNGSTTATLSDTLVDTFLTRAANNYASLSYYINNILDPNETIDLTDSSGGGASSAVPPVIAAQAAPAAFTTSATDCSPKAGFDTALGVIETNQAEIAAKLNSIINYRNLTDTASIALLVDSTGQTTNGTLESQSVNLAAVTGTTVCVDRTTALVSLTAVRNNCATLAAKANAISAYYGLIPITDSSTGVASTTALANVPTTTTGNDGTADATIADSVMDTLLGVIRDTLSTLAARANALDDIGSQQTLMVAAGL